ncbi:T-complex protein 11-domain-containing protein [Leptodontidium sp. MPI-SDFR-AT-0119]|nr:T-complex protein 11-domain-containing protein [Leptodontidium sp. MPI-SDFR-AT-0119]
MESDASKRGRTNSLAAANDHANASSSNDGPMASQQTQESRSKGALEIHVVDESYDIAQGNKSGGSPSPRNRPSYDASPAQKPSRPSHPNYAPSQADRNSRSSHTEFASKSAERQTRVAAKPQPISIEPPVTKGTLSELDVTKIVNNPKLRHDINFDPELHFRPNLDGDKGRRKTEKANFFWDTMRGQLQDYLTNRDQFERELGDSEWCLPATLNAIRGILETLVPQRDKASVEETFNVDLLMQQFRMGVADLVKLALWLSQLLKCHCAPMRDNWVDDMVTQLSKGDRTGDVTMLVAGMKNLLGVLEAMKLDVANHQIRCLRPLLIDDTVHFEQKFFMKKIALGRVDIGGAHAWFRRARSLPEAASGSAAIQSQTWDFMKAMVQLTQPSKSELFPHTFLFDEERLIKLRADMLDMINLEICMQLYRNLDAQSKSYRDDTPTTSFASSPCDRPASPANDTVYSSPTIPSLHHFDMTRSGRQDHGHSMRHPLGRQSWMTRVDGSYANSSVSSPRSSPSSTASTPDTLPPTPLYLTPVSSDSASASQLRTSLLAILSSSTSSKKWDALSPDLALQILRQTTTPLIRLPQFESHLATHLSNPRSKLYQDAEEHVLTHLYADLTKLVETYTPLSSLQIFEAATAPRVVSANAATQGNGFKEEISEMATRMAHIGILHWRVWAPLAYLVDPDAEEEHLPNSERAKSMP